MAFTARTATEADLPAITALIALAIDALLPAFLTPAEVVASRAVMGLDTQLIADRTYFAVERDGVLAGCGGWSRRATLYGGDHSAPLRDGRPLDPATEPARVRAMYTHPDFTRQGIGRLILSRCEDAATAAGFGAVELMATLSGEPLYLAAGYTVIEQVADDVGGVAVPLVRMGKRLRSNPSSLRT